MSFGPNGQFTGTFYGQDRLGFTTPDCDSSEVLRPWLPVSYPAPWLPIKRRDDGHPVAAGVVISSHQLVGLDKSSALIPAGYFSGTQASIAGGGQYCIVVYGEDDVKFTMNPQTGNRVLVAGEHVVLACPSDAAPGNVTLDDGTIVAVSAGDIAFAKACTLIPGGKSRPIGYAIRNVFQHIGGYKLSNKATIDAGSKRGAEYTLNVQHPENYVVTNYLHEMGTAIQTSYVLRMPWIGKSIKQLQDLATADGYAANYAQTNFGRSFCHFTGDMGDTQGKLFLGCAVVGSDAPGDAGNYAPFDSAKHSFDMVCGRVIGIEKMYPIKDYANRVRTQFERANQLVGPRRERNVNGTMMGGSATRGMDYAIALGTDGIFRIAHDLGKPIHDEFCTYVLVHVNCR